MTQLIACKYRDGIVLAADSKAVDVDTHQNLIEVKVDRLHVLSPYTAVLNGGAVAGEAMCHALKNFVVQENLNYIDDVAQAALPFLASEYERFMRKTCEKQPIDPTHQLNFILGGYTPHSDKVDFQLHLLWTKRKLPLLDSDEIGTAFTVPRIIRLEYHLNQLADQDAGMDKMVTEVRQAMEKRAEEDSEVSAPLQYAVINESGLRTL